MQDSSTEGASSGERVEAHCAGEVMESNGGGASGQSKSLMGIVEGCLHFLQGTDSQATIVAVIKNCWETLFAERRDV
jgi:hypothetical protein